MVLKTNRSLVKVIFLSLITCGIYELWFWSTVGEDLNILVPTGKRTMHFLLISLIFSYLTLGIAPLVWMHRISNKAGDACRMRGINYDFGAGTFWLWGVLGSLIVVGPFIYLHKLCTAMNLACNSYNASLNNQNFNNQNFNNQNFNNNMQ